MHSASFTQVQSSQRLVAHFGDQRRMRRRLLGMAAWIIVYTDNSRQQYVARVRDMTRASVFFYSESRPSVCEDIDFLIKFPTWTN